MSKSNNYFIRIVFSFYFPCLYAFQPQTNEELQTAVDMWIDDNYAAMETYCDINEWDV